MVINYDYDNVNGDLRLNRLHYKDGTSATLADYEYTRRDDGFITSWSNSQTGDDSDLTYDGAGRLTDVKDGGVAQYQ